MATLKKSKLEAVIHHIKGGGDDSLEVIADIVDIDINEDEATIEAYVRKANKEIAAAEPGPEPPVKKEAPVLDSEKTEPIVYQLKDASGIIRELEVVRQKGNRVILTLPVATDTVTVLIKGVEELVDLEELRKLGPNELHLGVKVSTLIAAAELAKG